MGIRRFSLLLAFTTLCFAFLFTNDSEGKQVIRITAAGPEAFSALRLPKGMDEIRLATTVREFVVTDEELEELKRRGISYQVVDDNLEKTQSRVRADYHSLAELESDLQSIASTYPAITDLFSIGKSHQNRDIWCLEISDNPGVDEGETELLFLGLHHAREWPSLEVALHLAETLTSNYGSDPTITGWVNSRRIWVVACVNPDGYYYCHDQGVDWRKNRHYLPQHGTTGVDLNRNYGGSRTGHHKGTWGSIADGSVTHHPDQSTYCGPSAASENETQAIMNFVLAHRITILLSYHTHSQLVIWPWGFEGSEKTPDDAVLISLGTAMANRITKQSGSGTYKPQQSAALYPAMVDTTDWAYGAYYYLNGKNILPYTIELCSSFHPDYSYMAQVKSENWDAVEYALDEADNLRNSMTAYVLPPQLDAPVSDGDGNYRVTWIETNPDANPLYFHLDELSDLTIAPEGAEAGTGLWNMNGFSTSTSKKHAGARSFKSRYSNEDVSSMTTQYPLPVETGDTLNFWAWYDIEVDWDFGFAEVSVDLRKWDQLDHFTGSSSGWKQKSYSLNAYAGKSVFIRFRYTTDANTQEEGFYVDDIARVPAFGTVTALATNTPDTFFDVSGNSDGDYYYRVKGYSATRGWGDFSFLDKTVVEVVNPPQVTAITPVEGYMAGGTLVTLTGSEFTATGDTDVEFGGEPATGVVVLNASTATCTTPLFPHPGFVEVSLINSNGTGALADGFEFVPGAGMPQNMTDLDTLNLNPPQVVNLYVTGNANAFFLPFYSLGGGPTPTSAGIMGMDFPLYQLYVSKLNAKGYKELPLQVPAVGPLEFYLQVIVEHGFGVWAVGGNNPNGSGSIKFVLP